MNKILAWILGGVALALGVLFLAYKTRKTSATPAAGAVATGTVPTTPAAPVNRDAQTIAAVGGALTGVIGSLGGLFK